MEVSECCNRLACTVLNDVYGNVFNRYGQLKINNKKPVLSTFCCSAEASEWGCVMYFTNNRLHEAVKHVAKQNKKNAKFVDWARGVILRHYVSSDDDIPSRFSMPNFRNNSRFLGSEDNLNTYRTGSKRRFFRERDPDRPSSDEELRVLSYRSASLFGSCNNIDSLSIERNTKEGENLVTSIRLPRSYGFTPIVGKRKIVEFIEKTWTYTEKLTYTVELSGIVPLSGIDRYQYTNRWSNGSTNADVYFNVDVSRINKLKPIVVTYKFPDSNSKHRKKFRSSLPNQSIADFFKHMDQNTLEKRHSSSFI